MALFPDNDETVSAKNIKKTMDDFYESYSSHNNYSWQEAHRDSRFEMGDSSIWAEVYGFNPSYSTRKFNFNRIKKNINLISGHQRQNRKSINVVPVENSDSETADQFAKVIKWISNFNSLDEKFSDAYRYTLISGLSFLYLWKDYATDPISGNIRIDNCTYDSIAIDPFFKQKDLSDCSAIWMRSYVSKQAAKNLVPKDKRSEIDKIRVSNTVNKFQYMPENSYRDIIKLLPYDEFYYADTRKQLLLYDPDTGESLEWTSSQDNLNQFLTDNPKVKPYEQEIPTVKLAIVCGGVLFYDGPNPLRIDKYPFVPFYSTFNPNSTDYSLKFESVVRSLRDAQYLYNRRKVIELDMLESQINTGIKYVEGSIKNPKDLFKKGQGQVLEIAENFTIDSVQQIMPPAIAPTTLEVSRILADEIQQISGINEELVGSAVDDKAGILSMLRQKAGLTTLQGLFDNLDFSQKLLGNLLIRVIQTNFTPVKIKNIIEQEPTYKFYNGNFGKYDAVIEDGINTSTQRQAQFAQLLHLKETNAIPIPSEVIIDSMTVTNKKQLVEAINAQEQQMAQQEQQRQQVELAELQARINLTEAHATERVTRASANEGLEVEREREAVKDDTQATLNLMKSLKELESIDIEQISKLLSMLSLVKGQTSQVSDQNTKGSGQRGQILP